MARHGCPQIVVTDNGMEWQAAFQELMDEGCIEVRKTSPYHPQANGLVQRFHGTLKEKLSQAALKFPALWDVKMADILLGYRATPRATTKYSPFQLLYGRKAVLPIDNKIGHMEHAPTSPTEQLSPKSMEEEHAAARENISKEQRRQKRMYKEKLLPFKRQRVADGKLWSLERGALVAIKNRKKQKMAPPYVGPYIFVGYQDNDTVIIKNCMGVTWKESIYTIGLYKDEQCQVK
jgi:hypothetical protein